MKNKNDVNNTNTNTNTNTKNIEKNNLTNKNKNKTNNNANLVESMMSSNLEIETVEKDFCLEDGSFIEINLSDFN